MNRKIKYRVISLMSLIILVVFFSTFLLLQYTYKIYDEHIYRESAKSLNMASTFIETELRKLVGISYNIIADPQIQEHLQQVKSGELAEYDKFRLRQLLQDRLVSFSSAEKTYLSSISIYDLEGREYIAGMDPVSFGVRNKRELIEQANRLQGEVLWQAPNEWDSSLILARSIRSYTDLSLDTLGTIVMRIHMERMMMRLAREIGINGDALFIYNDMDLVYSQSPPVWENDDLIRLIGIERQGYQIAALEDQTYFVTFIRSRYTGWTYLNLIPYDTIFNSIVWMKNLVIAVFVILFLVMIALGIKFARGITRPIERLNEKMKWVGLGNFNIPLADAPRHMDEIGQLHRNFRIMIEKINELIEENYSKQLVIKDTEYKALQAQINPHFLYNTLDSINWLAKMNRQHKISTIVESLGFMLRAAINQQEAVISLADELDIVNRYVTIQKIRFEERLQFELDIPENCLDASLPKLTLQPLVENAIYHALDKMLEPCHIRLSARRSESEVEIKVEDNGPGIDEEVLNKWRTGPIRSKGKGIGLTNIAERLKRSFGEQASLDIEGGAGKGTKVSIRLPYHPFSKKERNAHVESAAR